MKNAETQKKIRKPLESFVAAARAAECDEDPARFEDRLKKVAKSTPVK